VQDDAVEALGRKGKIPVRSVNPLAVVCARARTNRMLREAAGGAVRESPDAVHDAVRLEVGIENRPRAKR
jgi:hypothetical protein